MDFSFGILKIISLRILKLSMNIKYIYYPEKKEQYLDYKYEIYTTYILGLGWMTYDSYATAVA